VGSRDGALADPMLKVICPGFGRTGTTSLAQALAILGWRTREVEGHWYLVRRQGDRLVFRPDRASAAGYDALLDSPVPIVYRRLLDLFPHSVLIVTVRPLDEWLCSIQQLEQMQSAAFAAWGFRSRRGVQMKRLFEAYNRQAYGAPRFERRTYADHYERHYAELHEFIRASARPAIEIELTRAADWAPICALLGVPAPGVPFPHRNRRLHG
jgi:hypothetical protein